jgi:hypothetical protein
MNDEVVARFAERFAVKPALAADEAPAEESTGAFGFLRGARDRALMLELRFKHGEIHAFSYSLLDRLSFDPSDGLRLKFAGQEVHIMGQRLNDRSSGIGLIDAVLKHRATWIQEASRADAMAPFAAGPLIESIRMP